MWLNYTAITVVAHSSSALTYLRYAGHRAGGRAEARQLSAAVRSMPEIKTFSTFDKDTHLMAGLPR